MSMKRDLQQPKLITQIIKLRLSVLLIDVSIIAGISIIMAILFLYMKALTSTDRILGIIGSDLNKLNQSQSIVTIQFAESLSDISQNQIFMFGIYVLLFLGGLYVFFNLIQAITSYLNWRFILPRNFLTFEYLQNVDFANKKVFRPILIFCFIFMVFIGLLGVSCLFSGKEISIDYLSHSLNIALLFLIGILGGFELFAQFKWGIIHFRKEYKKLPSGFIRLLWTRFIDNVSVFVLLLIGITIMKSVALPWAVDYIDKSFIELDQRISLYTVDAMSLDIEMDYINGIVTKIDDTIKPIQTSISSDLLNETSTLIDNILPVIGFVITVYLFISIVIPWIYSKTKYLSNNTRRVPVIIIASLGVYGIIYLLTELLIPNVFNLVSFGPLVATIEIGFAFILGLLASELIERRLSENPQKRKCWHCAKNIEWDIEICNYCKYPLSKDTSSPPKYLVNVISNMIHRPQCKYIWKCKGMHLRGLEDLPNSEEYKHLLCKFCLEDMLQ